MAIDVQQLPIDVAEVPREEFLAALDAECRRLIRVSADEFIAAVEAGRVLDDDPSVARLRVLAKTFIDSR